MSDVASLPSLAGLRVVVAGVSGVGKSTIALALATALSRVYVDADDLHDDAARAKMSAGVPLTDDDRAPWLGRVGTALAAADAAGAPAVMACSALRRRYRDRIRETAGGPVFFVLLTLDEAALAARMRARTEHFMPVSLLASQLATLEPLDADEAGVTIVAAGGVDEIVAAILAELPRA